ncbi:MAG: A/G-specific adenine glycosylase [Verrucomicrobiaceae bacterium]|nr:A/G-specific adenine glycosylase [Verrucomicrobiaceae bacterium]
MTIAPRLLEWFDRNGRKNLPWQQDISPYRVWVSEIMLQQTQVQTVIPYYHRFMQALPTVQDLAAASEDAVMHLWTGLGYYSRARNLRRSAQIICSEFGGEFPNDVERLSELPGVGRSTAGAIVSIAFQRRAAILDGNVKRVLARVHAVDGYPGVTSVARELWERAEQHTPEVRVADYTQAIMDLGATLCSRTKPACGICPLVDDCQAHELGTIAQFPGKKPPKVLPVKRTQMLMIGNSAQELLLEKRPPTGIWSGLWIFPQADAGADPIAYCSDQLGIEVELLERWREYRHTFSHYHLDIEPVRLRLKHAPPTVMEPERHLWYNLRAPAAVGLAAPVAKLLEKLA